jgi:thiol-disulfide isomerase/thioredoxin
MRKLVVLIMVLMLAVACSSDKGGEAVSESKIETKSAGFVEELKQQYAGKVLVVNFFASWCPPCRGETPDFVKAYENNKDKNFVIVGISVDKKKPEVDKFVDEFKVTYPIYHADSSLGAEMNIGTIPTSMIYKPDGKLFDIVVGPLTEAQLEKYANSFE